MREEQKRLKFNDDKGNRLCVKSLCAGPCHVATADSVNGGLHSTGIVYFEVLHHDALKRLGTEGRLREQSF